MESQPESQKNIILKNRQQCSTWGHRAGMALQQGNSELTLQALQRAHQYQVALAELIEIEIPPAPGKPEDVRNWLVKIRPALLLKVPDLLPDFDMPPPPTPRSDESSGPLQPTGVPRRPLPYSGAGEIALPLPELESANEHNDD